VGLRHIPPAWPGRSRLIQHLQTSAVVFRQLSERQPEHHHRRHQSKPRQYPGTVTTAPSDGVIQPGELEAHLRKPRDWLRNYLAGDVLPLIHDFFEKAGGRFHAALYELEDEELVDLLKANAERLDLILSDAGSGTDEGAEEDANGKKPTIYDTRNSKARKALRERGKTGRSVRHKRFAQNVFSYWGRYGRAGAALGRRVCTRCGGTSAAVL